MRRLVPGVASCASKPTELTHIYTQSNRLVLANKRRIHVMKRAGSSSPNSIKFESLHSFEVPHVIKDVCLITEDDGSRWMCVSTTENVLWMSTERGELSHVPTLPVCDFFIQGRRPDEVLCCRGSTCTFSSPKKSSGSKTIINGNNTTIEFSHPVWSVVLCKPFVLGALTVSKKIEVRLDFDGQLVHIIDLEACGAPSSAITTLDRSLRETMCSVVALGAGGEPSSRVFLANKNLKLAFEIAKSWKDQVSDFRAKNEYSLARSFLSSLLRDDSTTHSSLETSHEMKLFYDAVCVDFGLHLLKRRPWCTADDATQASKLFREAAFPSRTFLIEGGEEKRKVLRFLRCFADTDLFETIHEAEIRFHELLFSDGALSSTTALANTEQVKSEYSRFDSRELGVFGNLVRHVLIPALFNMRISVNGDFARETNLDSFILRAFVLGRPTKNTPESEAKSFAADKRSFLRSESNRCSIQDGQKLLLRFPEMWEDHAALLAGKGEFKQALGWLQTLGKNAADGNSLDEKYAVASVRMLDESAGGADLCLEFCSWFVGRYPQLASDALVRFKCFRTVSQAREYFHNDENLFMVFLERIVQQGQENCSLQFRDALAFLYIERKSWVEFETFVTRCANDEQIKASEGLFSFEALLPKLDEFPSQQALVLDCAHRRSDAAFTLATKCPLAKAEAYARLQKCRENVFDVVFDGILADARVEDAVKFLSRNFSSLKDPTRALNQLPDDLSLESLDGVFRAALSEQSAAHREHVVTRQLLKSENLVVMEKLSRLRGSYVVVNSQTTCSVCGRQFKPESPIVVHLPVWYVDAKTAEVGTVAHFSCVPSSQASSPRQGFISNSPSPGPVPLRF